MKWNGELGDKLYVAIIGYVTNRDKSVKEVEYFSPKSKERECNLKDSV